MAASLTILIAYALFVSHLMAWVKGMDHGKRVERRTLGDK